MPYKITALKNVTVQIAMPTQIRESLGNGEYYMKPGPSRQEWLTLRPGETREVMMVEQLHPKHGVSLSDQQFFDGDLPKEFAGLYRLEISSTSA